MNRWKSKGSLIKVVFCGTENLLTFTVHGTVLDVNGTGVSLTGAGDLFINFSFASVRFSSGSPKGNGNPEIVVLCEVLRSKDVDVVELFSGLGDVLLFPVLDAVDTDRRIM